MSMCTIKIRWWRVHKWIGIGRDEYRWTARSSRVVYSNVHHHSLRIKFKWKEEDWTQSEEMNSISGNPFQSGWTPLRAESNTQADWALCRDRDVFECLRTLGVFNDEQRSLQRDAEKARQTDTTICKKTHSCPKLQVQKKRRGSNCVATLK